MRSQVSNTGQSSKSNDQKKSVFDRLGRQLDTGRSMKRRPSPGQYADYMPPPPSVHDTEFGRYGPREPHSQAELEWRYQNERRHMSGPYPRDIRHPAQMQPGPPPPLQQPPPSHYEMEMGNGRQPPYYQNPHAYHNGPQGPPPPGPPMGPGNMSVHQRRSSPKYDRHGNLIMGFKERGNGPMRGPGGPLDHHPGMSPSRGFIPPGPMMHQGPHEMQPGMRPPVGMYPPHRWPDNVESEFQPPPHVVGRMMQDGRFSPAGSRRYQQHQQQQMMNTQATGHPSSVSDAPRYTKWRERRDVITNLDKETAQSSSRTDSLKSTLQQADGRGVGKGSESQIDDMKRSRGAIGSLTKQHKADPTTRKDINQSAKTESSRHINKELGKNPAESSASKIEPQEISDGEIVDDEDSSDDSETVKVPNELSKDLLGKSYLSSRSKNPSQNHYQVGRNRESHQYFESSKKKRRLLDREDYSMDYETISDEDLDDFMDDKKVSDLSPEEAKLSARLGDDEGKSLSEIELLNALGLDWANLVEMAKQSKASGKENATQGSALPRFSVSNYLPTLGITPDLAGPEIYDLVLKVCRS